jgi:Flp pilus assembly protein TadD
LINQEKVSQAVNVFRLNVMLYPKSANTYDSLGEAYMILGEDILAVENYKKSLELDPENTNAADMLKELVG